MTGNELELTGNLFGTIWVVICVVLAAWIVWVLWSVIRDGAKGR